MSYGNALALGVESQEYVDIEIEDDITVKIHRRINEELPKE